ncbi:unnamed protein product [Polarella glacialis]|uniref:Uncharacterized protein n=2 Tax=Polarella glacialis TaxID=89957 RepID=A0A813HN07_POLGL|nr:unnamed protein product [Polarella glacialis]
MEEPQDASLAELQKCVSQVVKKVLQEELQELKDLLARVLQQQSSLSEERKKTQSTAPKPERCKRLAPVVMPRIFTDQSGSVGPPVTLEQLQEKHAEWVRELSHSDDMERLSPLAAPSQLRSVIAAASLKPKTVNESSVCALVSVSSILASQSNQAPAHSLGKVVGNIGDADSLSEGRLEPPCPPLSAPCAPSPDGLLSIHGPPVRESLPSSESPVGRRAVATEFPGRSFTKRSIKSSLTRIWAARDELLVFPEADCVMAEADDKRFKNDLLEEASLSHYGKCMSMTAQVLFKLFGILTFQGRAGYLLPAIVNLILLRARQYENYDSWSLQLSHVVAAAVFAVLMFLKLHILSCLDLMIDDFSLQYAELGDAEQGILQWSLIQATLNQASNRLEGSFLISFTAIVAGFDTLSADLIGSTEMLDHVEHCSGEASWLLQPLLMIISKGLLLTYILLRAAGISHKCERTKHFINSLLTPLSEDSSYLDTGRSYLVRYIDDSAAGFCIQGGRITFFAVMKLFYGMCALTFAIVTQAYSS